MQKNNLPAWLADAFTGDFISLHDYMQTCLYHPQYGYYTTGKNFQNNLGADFTTAPLLTPLFGAALAHWIAQAHLKIGAPKTFILAEAGPGDGTLMLHLLNYLPKHLLSSCEVMLIETSPSLTQLQQQKLAGKNVQWATTFLPQKYPIILIANELLDAFPVHQYEFKNGAWLERGFNQKLQPTTRPAESPSHPVTESLIYEESPEQIAWLEAIKKHSKAALLIDYGYLDGHGDSIQALHNHQPVPLTHQPGEADLTAHVNFAQVKGTLEGGCTVSDMANFLLQNKILKAAEPSIHDAETAAALHRLLHPTRMGALFKVAEYFAE